MVQSPPEAFGLEYAAVFDAHFESASPVASGSLDSPIKYFSARFRIDQRDPRLLPDLSAAVEIEAAK